MKYYYNPAKKTQVDILQRLSSMSLAFENECKEITIPVLEDGQERILGETDIHLHLDKIQEELHQWHYCNC